MFFLGTKIKEWVAWHQISKKNDPWFILVSFANEHRDLTKKYGSELIN